MKATLVEREGILYRRSVWTKMATHTLDNNKINIKIGVSIGIDSNDFGVLIIITVTVMFMCISNLSWQYIISSKVRYII